MFCITGPPREVHRGQRPSSVPPGLPLNPKFTRSAVLKQKPLHRYIHSCIYLWENPMSTIHRAAKHTTNSISADLAHCTLLHSYYFTSFFLGHHQSALTLVLPSYTIYHPTHIIQFLSLDTNLTSNSDFFLFF